jgi:CubicO group peptidase (beta-lactamase class C family)
MRALLLVLAVAAVPARAQSCPSRPSWPTEAWPVKRVDESAKAAALKTLEDYAFTLVGADAERLGLRTEALLIIKDGALAYERYAKGYGPSNRHLSWSVAKSITSGLVGAAVARGALTLDDSVCTSLTEYSGDVCDITVRDTITFATGLDWQEGYEHESYQASSVISMFFGVGHRDMLRHILTHRRHAPPGTGWRYSTGDATLAATVAKRALEAKLGPNPFGKVLFDKLGMSRTVVEEDAKGAVLGGSHIFATARDYARYGYLFLNDGCWNGERLLPEGWVKASTTVSAAFAASADANQKTPSGYSWWLNQPVPAQGKPRPWPDAPDDAFSADGHWGQFIVVVPSEDVVIVRLGDDRNDAIDLNRLIPYALEVVR